MKFQEKHFVRLQGVLALILILLLTSGLSYPGSAYAKDKVISQESAKLLGKLSDALAEVAEIARPSVVNISTTTTVSMENHPYGDFFNDPFFRHFFGDQFDHRGQKRKFKSSALGSGVIVSENGYILTNNHVVNGADEIKVILYVKRVFKGTFVGTVSRTVLAVI